MKELNAIQVELNAPKSRTNEYAGFKFRSLEDIEEASKPLRLKYGCTLTFNDEIVLIGDRYYVKATAVLKNAAGEVETATAFAREQVSKKGLDEAQVTGTASSYARKYAACALFAIDDSRDPDFLDNRDEGQPKVQPNVQPKAQQQAKPRSVFGPVTTPKAWASALERARTTGDITRLHIADRYEVPDSVWQKFTKEVNS